MTTTAKATAPRDTQVAISRVSSAEGHDGTPQWELQVRWPSWTPAANQGGDKTWVDKAAFPTITGETKGTFNCSVIKSTLKNKREGGKHDGSKDWMWNWRIVTLDVPEASTPANPRNPAAPVQRGQPSVASEPDTAIDPGPAYQPPRYQQEIPPPVPQALGACQNNAMAFIQAGIIPLPEGRDPINFLWELRDAIYRGVNAKPYHAERFCYRHEAPLIKSKKGVWGHVLPDGTACFGSQDAGAAAGAAGADAGATP